MTDFRSATLEDHAQIHALLCELARFHEVGAPWLFQEPSGDPWPRSWLEAKLASSDADVFVAMDAGVCLGVATVGLREPPDFPAFRPQIRAVIDDLIVRPDARRQGIARALYQRCEDWAQAHQAAWVEVNVYEFNAGAIATYDALGLETFTRKMRKPLGK